MPDADLGRPRGGQSPDEPHAGRRRRLLDVGENLSSAGLLSQGMTSSYSSSSAPHAHALDEGGRPRDTWPRRRGGQATVLDPKFAGVFNSICHRPESARRAARHLRHALLSVEIVAFNITDSPCSAGHFVAAAPHVNIERSTVDPGSSDQPAPASKSSARMVDVSAVLDAKHVNYDCVVVDAIDHAVFASAGNVLVGEFTGERLPDSARVGG